MRSPSAIARILAALLGAGFVIALVSVGWGVVEHRFASRGMRGGFLDESEVASIDRWRAWLVGIQIVVGAITAVAFVPWTYRIVAVAREISPVRFPHSPAWSAAAYFIPVAGFFVPILALLGAYRTFCARTNVEPKSVFLHFWWALWLVSGFVARVVARITADPASLEEYVVHVRVSIAIDALHALLTIAAIQAVMLLTRACDDAIRVAEVKP